MENWKAQYDESQFLMDEIEFFQQDKQEFAVSILNDEDRDPLTITKDEIEDHFYNDIYVFEIHKDQFLNDLNDEFMEYVDEEVFVEGRNMGWRNRTGYKQFTLRRGEDMFYKIAPECDLTYYIEKVKDREYEVRISHHDSPTGEYYTIKIK